MIARLSRIKHEFGTKVYLKTLLLIAGLVGMSVMGVVFFGSPLPAVASLVGLMAGWLLRGQVVEHGESLTWALPAALTAYGILLFFGEKVFGISRELQLLIITVVTVIVFDIQFWWLSDSGVINAERDE